MTEKTKIVLDQPTEKQIRNCEASGWEYIGDGIFAKDEELGYFENNNFVKV